MLDQKFRIQNLCLSGIFSNFEKMVELWNQFTLVAKQNPKEHSKMGVIVEAWAYDTCFLKQSNAKKVELEVLESISAHKNFSLF